MRFEVYKRKLGYKCCEEKGTTKPSIYPCFELVFNDGWNDYGVYSWFALWYFKDKERAPICIGELKIVKRGEDNTFDCIPKAFTDKLPKDFCSLGIQLSYYRKLKESLSREEQNFVLTTINDAAVSKHIQEEFAGENVFVNSLLRDLSSNQALSHAIFVLKGVPEDKAYSFSYNLTINNNNRKELISRWNVTLPFEANVYSRLLGIIGNNGVGKTTLLRNFVDDLLNRNVDVFNNSIPLFDSLCVISSTKHDQYRQLDRADNKYHLAYLDSSKIAEIKDTIRSINVRKTLNGKSLISIYHGLLLTCIGNQINILFEPNEEEEDGKLLPDNLDEIYPILSSGQRQILLMVSNLFAHIHLSSLIIIDEPEVHLHPKALTEFMSVLSNIINLFKSFAVVVTHSPLIVREIITPNVYQMQRLEGDIPSIGKVGFDTFGEDIALLYSRIFGYDENESVFTRIVSELCRKARSANSVIKRLETEMGIDLNLNAKMRVVEIFNRVDQDA